MRAVIVGTGMYIPPTIVDNNQMARVMDTSDEWIRERTGIVTRHFAEEGEATSDIAVPAARQALANAGFEPADIDYVIFATMTPDCYFPGSAPFLQRKLGLETIPCLDIRQQCAGFVYALQLADALVRSGQHRNILVVGAEVHSSLMPWRESWGVVLGTSDEPIPDAEREVNVATRDRTVLFGDGAGAMVISPGEEDDRGILDVLLFTDGQYAEKLWTEAGGSRYRPYFHPDMIASGDIVPQVKGREVFRLAVTYMPDAVLKILERNDKTIDDLDLLIMHQANLRINESVQKRLGLPDDKVFNNIQRYGNTTAGTIPIALHEAREAGHAKPGDLVCFVALGSGLNWGAVLYRF